MAYPTTIEDTNAGVGASGNPLSNPNHIDQHNTECNVIDALQAKVGVNGSAVTTSHDYKLSEVTSTDKAVGKSATQDLTNKNLGVGTKITIGSDATGDIWYRHSDGTIKRLAADEGKILKIVGGVPTYQTETVTSDASTTVKGIVEEATLAEIDANTATGGTSARLFVNPSTLGKSTDGTLADNSDAKIPSQKAVKTYVDNSSPTITSGTTTKNISDASTTQNIAHGLGKIPKRVKIVARYATGIATGQFVAETVYNGTTQSSLSTYGAGTTNAYTTDTNFRLGTDIGSGGVVYQTGVVTFDATNISIAWTRTSTPANVSYTILWEAQ